MTPLRSEINLSWDCLHGLVSSLSTIAITISNTGNPNRSQIGQCKLAAQYSFSDGTSGSQDLWLDGVGDTKITVDGWDGPQAKT